jgi:2-dehydro-3-deoxyphosphooctonate aldolase (KDO 8-P synthase)
MKTITIGDENVKSVTIGNNRSLCLMAGPCVIESEEICFEIAEFLKNIAEKLNIGYVFKASFDKANRTSIDSYRGPGLQDGLRMLNKIRQQLKIPVVSDIHLPEQAVIAAEVLDILQIPAFLCRQTDLIIAAAVAGKVVQVKKAQFMAPWDMENVVGKIKSQGNENIILVERGSSFGYNRLICDMTSIAAMQKIGYPAVMDATHATQQPGGLGGASGGSPEMAPILARAAVAAGADGLFLETHPDPTNALSDAASMIPLSQMENLLACCKDLFHRVKNS